MSEDRATAAERFWGAAIGPVDPWVRKYAALDELAGHPDEPERKERIRAIASKWPGALREAELVEPGRIRMRGGHAAAAEPSAARRSLLDGGEVGWLLACELNRALRSLGRMRTQARETGRPWSYLGESAHLQGQEATLWPGRGAGLEQMRASVRLAYLALAWSSGISLGLLNQLIFERRGSWDQRAGDPAWAGESGPLEPRLRRCLVELR